MKPRKVFVSSAIYLSIPKSGKKLEKVLSFIDELAENSHLGGDYQMQHPTAERVVEVSVIADLAFYWWVDAAVQEVKVIECLAADRAEGDRG